MPNFKLLEHLTLKSRLNANFACSYSEDGRISILTESGIYILTLKGYIENPFPRFSFRKDHIKVTNKMISNYLHIDVDSFITVLPRELVYELVLDDCGRSTSITSLEVKPLQAKWSPRGLIGKTDCALAVLTNFKNLEIYVKSIDEHEIVRYECVSHGLKYVSDFYKGKWKDISEVSANESKYTELKQRATLITPTGFEWSHLIENNGETFCILFITHKNGSVSAWKFNEKKINDTEESKLKYLGRYNTNLKHITAINWHRNKNTAGGLTLGDKDGKVCCLYVSKLIEEKIKFDDEVMIYEDEDFPVDKIILINLDIVYLIIVKQNYLFIYAVDEEGNISNAVVFNFGNLYITEIQHYKDNTIIALDLSGQLKLINLCLNNGKVSFQEELVNIESDLTKFRTHGFVLSPNRVFCGVLLYPCQLKDFGKEKDYVNFLIFSNSDRNPLQILWEQPKQHLRDYWDCFETLRMLSIIEKRFPWQGLPSDLNYDTMSIIQLKILRWISKLSEKVYHLVPIIKEYNIKAYVLLNYTVDIKLAIMRMRKLLNIHFTNKLSLFQFRSLDLLNFFLKEMVAKDVLLKANLGETFIDEMYEVMSIANELEYPDMPQCLWCGEKIIGSSCVPFHADSRCSISLMPISLVPGYKCPFCKCIVSKEMENEYNPIFCPYCDVPMEPRISNDIYSTPPNVITSDCHSDCINEDISDFEYHNHEYVILTDSEDEENGVKDMFERVKRIILSNKEDNNKEEEDLDKDEGDE